jgi:tRNA 2-selenouridine synthase
MSRILLIEDYLQNVFSKNYLLLDVRSESEFFQGRIPGAVNVPLLDDETRKEVGITYKQQGKNAAVEKGFELTGGKFHTFIRTVQSYLATQPQTANFKPQTALLYCWRGGMRSGIMSWLLETAGIRTILLKGGYKSYRRWALQQIETERKIIVLGGKTGSGKTFLLNRLKESGEQVLDLEALANHRGSAFGAIGMEPQPRQEHFENLIAFELGKTNPNQTLWIENESRRVGSLKVPDSLFNHMLAAPLVEIVLSYEERINRIDAEYGKFPVEELKANTIKLERSLGGGRMKEAVQLLEENKIREWIKMMLEYYDKTYEYGLSLRNREQITKVEFTPTDVDSTVTKILSLRDSVFMKPAVANL